MSAIGQLRGRSSRFTPGQIIALIACLAAGGFLGWYGFTTAFGDGSSVAAPLQTVTITPRTITQTATTSGNIAAIQNSKLTFAVAGRLASLNVKVGQSVKTGDVIATLDPTTLQIALDQAKSTATSTQAKLDALLAGATPDVIAAARAAVVGAQSSQVAAQSQLDTARTNAVTAGNAVGTAQNQVATATNAVGTAENQVATAINSASTAHDQVTSAQNAVQTAQNNYQALLNGPTAQDVAVAQSSVDAARTSLDSAQAAYDRLVNHTDAATRPETTALVTASSAYQNALAALANAQPQPTNPIDIANQQLAVQTAQAQLGLAQSNAALAQTSLDNANANLAAAQQAPTTSAPSTVTPITCVVSTVGNSCTPEREANTSPGNNLPATNTAVTQAQSAVLGAQGQVNSSSSALINAQATYQKALNDLQKLLNPTNTQNYGGLQAAVDSARQQLDIARRNYDNYIALPDLAVRPEAIALANARSAYNSAVAGFNQKVAPAKDTDLSNAQLQISNAQSALDSARAAEASAGVAVNTAQLGVNNANVAVNSAQLGVNNAQATADNSGSAINSAASQVDSAGANITSAQKKVDQLLAPPLSTDQTQAVEAVKQANLNVQKAQSDLDNATLKAPFAGTITAATGNPGDQVTAATVIAQLVDPNRVELDAQVDETTFGQIKVGMPVQIRMDSLPGTNLTGTITTIVPSGTTTQGIVVFPVVITVNTPPGVTLPNQASASNITIILQAKPNVLVVPSGYIHRNAANVSVVDVIDKDGKRVETPVTLGITGSNGDTEVTSGLQAGDRIAKPLTKSGGSSSAFGQGGVPGLNGGNQRTTGAPAGGPGR